MLFNIWELKWMQTNRQKKVELRKKFKKWNKCEISAKKNRKVSVPGFYCLYKRILLVQKRPNNQQVSKNALLHFVEQVNECSTYVE